MTRKLLSSPRTVLCPARDDKRLLFAHAWLPVAPYFPGLLSVHHNDMIVIPLIA